MQVIELVSYNVDFQGSYKNYPVKARYFLIQKYEQVNDFLTNVMIAPGVRLDSAGTHCTSLARYKSA
ncbi:MAG: hypothetical protein AB8Z02_03285, partial [Coxiella endosymbiont of Haemaphysalis qinghaiensis]